jgi:hypothetical protein
MGSKGAAAALVAPRAPMLGGVAGAQSSEPLPSPNDSQPKAVTTPGGGQGFVRVISEQVSGLAVEVAGSSIAGAAE